MGLFLQPLDPNLSLPLFSAEPREPTGTVLHFLAPVQVSIPSSFRLILRVQFAQFLGTTDSDFFGILDSTKGLQVAIRAPEGSTRFAIRDRGYFQHVPKKKKRSWWFGISSLICCFLIMRIQVKSVLKKHKKTGQLLLLGIGDHLSLKLMILMMIKVRLSSQKPMDAQ